MQHSDQLQRTILLSRPPKRIISLVPSQTELLIDLGLTDKLVGVTKFCVHPTTIREEKTIVGGTKSVKLEKIKALKPDIILCNKEENTKLMVKELEKIAPVHVSDIYTLADAYTMILQYGELFSVEENAVELVKKIRQAVESFQQTIKERPIKKVAYFIWRNPWMVAGGNTFINELLQYNRLENVYATTDRYPVIKLEELRTVDYLLLSSEPFPFNEKYVFELEPYISPDKVKFVDGEYFSWYGSRLASAFSYFKKLSF